MHDFERIVNYLIFTLGRDEIFISNTDFTLNIEKDRGALNLGDIFLLFWSTAVKLLRG